MRNRHQTHANHPGSGWATRFAELERTTQRPTELDISSAPLLLVLIATYHHQH